MVSNDQRVDRYADAIFDEVVDHPMWIGDDGEPLDYLPERATRLTDFIYEAATAVIAMADAEQAELRAEVERLTAITQAQARNVSPMAYSDAMRRGDALQRRALRAEAKVARVEAFHFQDGDRCRGDGCAWPCPTIFELMEPE